MLLKWLRRGKKTVAFHQNDFDQALLAAVKAELSRQPGRSFSSLCKEALHQYLLSEQSYPVQSTPSLETRMDTLQAQFLSLEQRFFGQERQRLELLERQLQQLAIQVAQLSSPVAVLAAPPEAPNGPADAEDAVDMPVEEEDPVLSRISGLIDDF